MSPTPPDIHNFSSSSSHRLPTVSASAALKKLASEGGAAVSTGLKGLDRALSGGEAGGGWMRGEVTEVWGPPGVGKTACCIQAAANALRAGDKVLWIDTSTPLPHPRLASLLAHPPSLQNLTYHFTPTLPHLLALLTSLPLPLSPSFSLLIIDTITTLFAGAFPLDSNPERPPWASTRRFAVMRDVLARLGQLAATQGAAVVLVAQATTRVRRAVGTAALRPALWTRAWEEGVGARVVLLRDWGAGGEGVRFAGVTKRGGVGGEGVGLGAVVAFPVERDGLREVLAVGEDSEGGVGAGWAPGRKRKREGVSEAEEGSDEEFGWEGGMVGGLEELMGEEVEAVDAPVREREGGAGVVGESGNDDRHAVDQASEEDPEEAEFGNLIEQAREDDVSIPYPDHGDV